MIEIGDAALRADFVVDSVDSPVKTGAELAIVVRRDCENCEWLMSSIHFLHAGVNHQISFSDGPAAARCLTQKIMSQLLNYLDNNQQTNVVHSVNETLLETGLCATDLNLFRETFHVGKQRASLWFGQVAGDPMRVLRDHLRPETNLHHQSENLAAETMAGLILSCINTFDHYLAQTNPTEATFNNLDRQMEQLQEVRAELEFKADLIRRAIGQNAAGHAQSGHAGSKTVSSHMP
jgi:hypothetical protein